MAEEHKEHEEHKPVEHKDHGEHKPAEHAEHIKEHKTELPASGRHLSERKGVILFAILGAIVGYISYLINWPPSSLALGIVVIAATYLVVKKGLKLAEPRKWWTNKIILYIFMWLVVWTIFFNVYIVKAL